MRVAGLLALVLLLGGCTNPVPLTATIETSATQGVAVGGRAQLVVKLTNTGPAIPHIGLVFMTADKWYEHHTVTDREFSVLFALLLEPSAKRRLVRFS